MTAAPTLPDTVTVRVPAKVNLQLKVGARRPDGYHELATVFQAVSLYDKVSATRWGSWEVLPTGTYAAGIPTDETNLAVKAAQLLAGRFHIDESLSLLIDKDIPLAGGMAGGSADAAATLLACDQLWGLGLDREELAAMASELGSDAPFPLHGGTAMASGRGEQIVPVLARGTFHWVFAVSDQGLSTPAVYAECDRLRELRGSAVPPPKIDAELMGALRQGDAVALGRALHNDLEPAAFSLRPELKVLRDAGVEFGALGGIVSGSGPTVAFLTPSHEAALDLSVSLAAADLSRDLRRAKGPVHGAHIVTGSRG